MNILQEQLKVVIVDDELKSRLYLEKLILQYCKQLEVIGMAADGAEAIRLISEKKPDLIFMDILLPGTNGFEIIKQVNTVNSFVVFVSAHEEFGIKAIHANAIDYILKPINILDLQQAVDRVTEKSIERKKKEDGIKLQQVSKGSTFQKITLPYSDGFHILCSTDINHLESDNSYTTVYKSNGEKIVCTRSIHEFEKILNESYFIRIHRSHIINLNYVQGFNRKYQQVVILNNGKEVPVARRKLKLFQEKLEVYLNQ